MALTSSSATAFAITLCTAFAFAPTLARAGPVQPGGTDLSQLAFGEAAAEGMRTMNDEELGEARGGYGGFYFELFGFGDIGNLGGEIPDGMSIGTQTADQVSLSVGLAGLPNSGGFIQFANVVGNNNVVNNNLILNVYFLEGGVADTSGMTSGAMLGF